MKQLDPMRIIQHCCNLIHPIENLGSFNSMAAKEYSVNRVPIHPVHRYSRKFPILNEVIYADNSRMNQLAIALHLLAQLSHRPHVPNHRLRNKVERNLFTEHLILGQPNGEQWFQGYVAKKNVTSRQLLAGHKRLNVRIIWKRRFGVHF